MKIYFSKTATFLVSLAVLLFSSNVAQASNLTPLSSAVNAITDSASDQIPLLQDQIHKLKMQLLELQIGDLKKQLLAALNDRDTTLTVTKNTIGGDGTFSFRATILTPAVHVVDFTITTSGGTGSYVFNDPLQGIYQITETVPLGWMQTSSTCDSLLVGGTDITCTIVNTRNIGTLRIFKNTTGGDGTFDFQMTSIPSALAFFRFSIATTDGTESYLLDSLAPGTYAIIETVPLGWMQTSSTCDSVTVVAGQDATCLITNTKTTGSIIVNKTAIGGDDDFSFTATDNNGSIWLFSIRTIDGTQSYTFDDLAPGTYSITEALTLGWAQTSSTCDSVTVVAGQDATCSVTNTYTPPPPVITSLSPPSVVAGSPGFTLTIAGTGFVNGSYFSWNGLSQITTYVSPTQLTVTIPASSVSTPGDNFVLVVNPDGQTSYPLTVFSVYPPNPPPVIASISPTSAVAGDPAFTLRVNGSGFVDGDSIVRFNYADRATVYISPTQLTAFIPASDIVTAGTFNITVYNLNPTPGQGISNVKTFTVNNPMPRITSIVPASVTVDSGCYNVDINGTNFNRSSVVYFNNFNMNPLFISPVKLKVTVSSSGPPRDFRVTVVNPSPGGGISNVKLFSITSVTPYVASAKGLSPQCGSRELLNTTTVESTSTSEEEFSAIQLQIINLQKQLNNLFQSQNISSLKTTI